jgi:hypothetical protein
MGLRGLGGRTLYPIEDSEAKKREGVPRRDVFNYFISCLAVFPSFWPQSHRSSDRTSSKRRKADLTGELGESASRIETLGTYSTDR